MAYGDNQQFPTRPKNILDDSRFTLYSEKPVEGAQKKASLKFHLNTNGQAVIDIYLNNSDDFKKSNVKINLDVTSAPAFFDTFRRALNDKDGNKYSLELKHEPWVKNKETGKMEKLEMRTQATLVMGRDKGTGVFYLGVVKYKMPSVRFLFEGRKNISYLVNDEPVSPEQNSLIWASNWLNAIQTYYGPVTVDTWKEPEKKEGGNNGGGNNYNRGNNNYNKGNGGNNYNSPSNDSFDEGSSGDDEWF